MVGHKKLISIVTPTYNEEENVEELYLTVKKIFEDLPRYSYEHIFIDNSSEDKTVQILKKLANRDKNLKIVVNSRNFGTIRSQHHGYFVASGECVIPIVCDFQEPPSMIPKFIEKWEQGNKIVVAVKKQGKENPLALLLRQLYYDFVRKLSGTSLIRNYSGFGLYDRSVVEILKSFKEPYPYMRGLIAEIGFDKTIIYYQQPKRKKGKTKNNLYVRYNYMMLGIINYSKVPLRLAAFTGFLVAILSLLAAFGYLVYKIFFWQSFALGMAPLVIGLFFFSAIQLIFIGVIGEYVGSVYTQVKDRPLVVEKERVNFEEEKM
ncbi:glycosyltransferase [Candidatus Woesearchaeota archaeon]|nr:glycosyltransferase [Candidatus Woesearchaeota archaeon]